MIEPLMRGGKGLIGETRDGLRIAAGDEAVGRVREQRTVHGVYQQLVRVGKRTLHLVEHNAGARQNAVVQLIMPALLLEDLRLFVDAGEEHSVEIHAHQVEKIAAVAACDGIAGFVRERQRVQERVQGALHQLDKWLLDRELLRAAQNGMLQNVKNARVVIRKRPEGGAEGLVFVLPLEPAEPRTGGSVGIFMQNSVQLINAALPRLFKSMQCGHRKTPFSVFFIIPHSDSIRNENRILPGRRNLVLP